MPIAYYFFRIFGFVISLFSYSAIHRLGKGLGSLAFFFHRNFRKKALSNLAIAYGTTKSEAERKQIGRASFQNLMTTCLEFFRLKKSKSNLSEIALLEDNPEVAALVEQKQGIIFLSAHQANWEVPFLALTERLSEGLAIGRPIKNQKLYKWILSVREMYGGKIVLPKNAIREGMKALKKGIFLGIVGDQAFPDSGYSYPLLGTRAWTAQTPAILAYRTKCPIVVGGCSRIEGKYRIFSSKPLWPDFSKPSKEAAAELMDSAMALIEASIQKRPEEWMWVHDRWKQQGIDHVKRKYRYGFVLVVLPPHPFSSEVVRLLRNIYPRSFLTFFISKETKPFAEENCVIYENEKDLFVRDFRYQIVLDFYGSSKLRRHFRKLGAFKTLYFCLNDLDHVKRTLVKSECLKTVSI